MTRYPRARLFLAVAALAAAVPACGPAGPPAPSAAERATSLARTAEYVLTSTAAAASRLATPTPLPTTTPEATATLEPSPTLEPPPTATVPAESPTAVVSPTPCENDSAFVADISVPDGSHFAQGAAFSKTWRLRNDSVCTWTTAYTLRFVSGEAMGGASLSLPNEVPAGATVDLTVPLTAPSRNGTFTGHWQLHSPDGTPFGSQPFVQIVVP
jgi:hypothetical protein